MRQRATVAGVVVCVQLAAILAVASVSPLVVGAVGEGYTSLVPARLLDTRAGQATVDGAYAGVGALPGNFEESVLVVGRGAVPSSGVAAVVINVTSVEAIADGFVTVYPTGTPRPLASSLNTRPQRTVANEIIAKVGAGGHVSLYSNVSTDLVIDVVGWFSSGSVEYTSLAPSRLMDTRNEATIDGLFSGTGQVFAATPRNLTVLGRGGVPVQGVAAVVLNVTATGSVGDGFLSVFPAGAAAPLASSLNYSRGQTVANEVVVKVGVGGDVSFATNLGADVIVDVVGWFPDPSNLLHAQVPARLLDTRPGEPTIDGAAAGQGALTPAAAIALQVTGRAGVPSTGVGSVVINVTAVGASGSGFVTAYPTGTSRPLASSLNIAPGAIAANEIIAKVGPDGKVQFFANVTTHLVVDVVGWIAVPGDPQLPNPTNANAFQAVYVVPADRTPVAGRAEAIAHEVAVVQLWYDGQTGGRHPVFRRSPGPVSVLTVQLTETIAQLGAFDQASPKMLAAVQAAFPATAPDYKFLVFEGTIPNAACGITSHSVLIAMDNCAIYPNTTTVFPYNMSYLTAHELTHALGAVPSCAPHFLAGGHIADDNRDVLYGGPNGRDWANLMLDPGHDDYYAHSNAGCTDIDDSVLLATG